MNVCALQLHFFHFEPCYNWLPCAVRQEFYVERGLRVIHEFKVRLEVHNEVQQSILDEGEVAGIFLNIDQIYDFNRKLHTELMKARMEGPEILLDKLGETMQQHIPFFKLYTQYIKSQKRAKDAYDVCMKKRKFQDFLNINEKCAGVPLSTLLSVPVMRLPQYLHFFGAIHNLMDQSATVTSPCPPPLYFEIQRF